MWAGVAAFFVAIGKALGLVERAEDAQTAEKKLEQDEQKNAETAQSAEDGRP